MCLFDPLATAAAPTQLIVLGRLATVLVLFWERGNYTVIRLLPTFN